MIKENARKPRFEDEKSLKEILKDCIKTGLISFCFAAFLTILLSFHARSEMIKNLYADAAERAKMDEKIASQIVAQSDLTKDLQNKNYAICIHVGSLYEAAKNYPNAEFAYRIAMSKAKNENFTPHFKLASVLISQCKFDEANDVIESVPNNKNKTIIKQKTRIFITMGDKYYSIGKFLKAAKSYEKALYFYDRFTKKDAVVDNHIKLRIINSYVAASDVMVKNGYNSDAVRFLKKAEMLDKNNFDINYKLAIVYSDLDPVQSIDYFEPLISKRPQDIDYEAYTNTLIKAANILDLQGDSTKAKYYRYKIYSKDEFIKHNVVYRNDVQVLTDFITIKKLFFKYKINAQFRVSNTSNQDMKNLHVEFILRKNNKEIEKCDEKVPTEDNVLLSYGEPSQNINVRFGKNIYTKKELSQYYIDIYVYKKERYKTLVATIHVPEKSFINKE